MNAVINSRGMAKPRRWDESKSMVAEAPRDLRYGFQGLQTLDVRGHGEGQFR